VKGIVCAGCHRVIIMAKRSSPSDFLNIVLGRPIIVKLNSGVEYRGVLACLDGFMNIAMEYTEEYVDGQLKCKYGDAFIRGNNVLYISTQKVRRAGATAASSASSVGRSSSSSSSSKAAAPAASSTAHKSDKKVN